MDALVVDAASLRVVDLIALNEISVIRERVDPRRLIDEDAIPTRLVRRAEDPRARAVVVLDDDVARVVDVQVDGDIGRRAPIADDPTVDDMRRAVVAEDVGRRIGTGGASAESGPVPPLTVMLSLPSA
jgi:hypothetical protein